MDCYVERNRISVHIVDQEALVNTYHFSIAAADRQFMKVADRIYVATLLTFDDMATFMLGESTYDFATPVSFWNSREDWRDCVWYYANGDPFGKPYNVIATFKEYIREQIKN